MATSLPMERKVEVRKNYDTWAWLFMRYSAVLLIPLVWIHVLINDVLVGVHAIDLTYVQQRWALMGWRVYDILLLSFTFAHGVNGLRTVTRDYLHRLSHRKLLDWGLLLLWLLISAIGAVAIVGGVRMP
jgi:succinate dehydrogenase / fumarate reductase membrane anchor subunit